MTGGISPWTNSPSWSAKRNNGSVKMTKNKFYNAISRHINKPATARHTPFIQGLYHGQWITLLTLVSLLILFAVLCAVAGTPPSLPLESIIRPPDRQSPMPVPEEWAQARSLEALCETALGDHLVSYELSEGTMRIDMLAQLSPVYPTASATDAQVQELTVNPQYAQAARQVAAYLIKACFICFPRDLQGIEIQISYPYRDGLGGSGYAPGDRMVLSGEEAAVIDWHTVTPSVLIEQTLR